MNRLRHDHLGVHARFYYFDVSWEETLRRHETRPQAAEFGHGETRKRYRLANQLGFAEERVIGQDSALEGTTRWVLGEGFGISAVSQ